MLMLRKDEIFKMDKNDKCTRCIHFKWTDNGTNGRCVAMFKCVDHKLFKDVIDERDSLDALVAGVRFMNVETGATLKEAANNIKVGHDMVNHPKHYNVNGMEAIDVIEAFTDGLNGIEATDTGNIIKYALRWHHKNGIEDLKKIVWYTNHLIKHLESKK